MAVSYTEWLIIPFIICLSAALQSATGFGFALMAVPALSLFFDPHWVIPLVMCTSFATLAMNMKTVWKTTDRLLLKKLLYGSMLGLPIGGLIFHWVDENMLRMLVSIGLLVCTALIIVQGRVAQWLRKHIRHDWVFGAVSGMMTTSVGLPGPPIMLLLAAKNQDQGNFRSTGISYLFYLYPVSLAILIVTGVSFSQIWKPLLIFVPFAFLGMRAGNKLHSLLSPKTFRSLIYLMLLATGLSSIVKTLQ